MRLITPRAPHSQSGTCAPSAQDVLLCVPPLAVALNESIVVLGNQADSPGGIALALQADHVRQGRGGLAIDGNDRVGTHQFAFAVRRGARSRAVKEFFDASVSAKLA